jgi:hypothetical protein
MNICSYGSRRDDLLTCFRSVIVSLIFPYSCLQLICEVHRKIEDRYFLYNAYVPELSFSDYASLSHILFVAGLACNFVYAIIRFQVLCCESYKLL